MSAFYEEYGRFVGVYQRGLSTNPVVTFITAQSIIALGEEELARKLYTAEARDLTERLQHIGSIARDVLPSVAPDLLPASKEPYNV
jgi:hypothetical protein